LLESGRLRGGLGIFRQRRRNWGYVSMFRRDVVKDEEGESVQYADYRLLGCFWRGHGGMFGPLMSGFGPRDAKCKVMLIVTAGRTVERLRECRKSVLSRAVTDSRINLHLSRSQHAAHGHLLQGINDDLTIAPRGDRGRHFA
jgi:hypothetical protein